MFNKMIGFAALITAADVLINSAFNTGQVKSSSKSTNQYPKTHSPTRNIDQSAASVKTNRYSMLLNLTAANGSLTPDEAAGLLHMREEEKLAHDVYTTFYNDLWGRTIFKSIANSEQIRTDTIKVLIERYGLTDPTPSQAGMFSSPDMQELDIFLVERGSQSLADALKVGAAIEEIDILDLAKYLAETDKADIRQVYQKLLLGSGGHLRAFAATLKALNGESYQPQHLSQATYLSILRPANGNGSYSQH